MGLFRKNRHLEQGTQRWNDLYVCLQSFAKNIWNYLVVIDDKEWDRHKVKTLIAAVKDDLRLAQQIWHDGKSILERLSRLFSEMIEVREVEHRLANNPSKLDFNNPKKQLRESDRWMKEMDEVQQKLEFIGTKMFDCCDEIKKWTSIDVRRWLEEGVG